MCHWRIMLLLLWFSYKCRCYVVLSVQYLRHDSLLMNGRWNSQDFWLGRKIRKLRLRQRKCVGTIQPPDQSHMSRLLSTQIVLPLHIKKSVSSFTYSGLWLLNSMLHWQTFIAASFQGSDSDYCAELGDSNLKDCDNDLDYQEVELSIQQSCRTSKHQAESPDPLSTPPPTKQSWTMDHDIVSASSQPSTPPHTIQPWLRIAVWTSPDANQLHNALSSTKVSSLNAKHFSESFYYCWMQLKHINTSSS